MESSDGEIKDDFSDISEEDYFDSIACKIEKRKLELELLNQIEIEAFDDHAKENRYENHRNRQNNPTTSSRGNNNFNRGKERSRKHSEVRNRSYRASSIFSTSYTLPKRRRQRRRRKYPKIKSPPPPVYLSSSAESIIEVIKNESDEEEELLALRLQALTSKQEVKSLISEPSPKKVEESTPITPISSPIDTGLQNNNNNNNNEEELLRIAALKSAILKKKDHFRKRKQQRKLENERPYSPTDKFEPFEPILDEAMDLSISPFGSPFHENLCDINEQIDMQISNSPTNNFLTSSNQDSADVPMPSMHDVRELTCGTWEICSTKYSTLQEEDNREACDMEIACSPVPEIINEEENEDELRSMLLSSINDKKKREEEPQECVSKIEEEPPSSPKMEIAKNLKMAVERIKQQKQQIASNKSLGKSGTKTIKMVLEEQKSKKLIKEQEKIHENEPNSDDNSTIIINNEEIVKEMAQEALQSSETFLIDKISSNPSLQQNDDDSAIDKVSITIEQSDSSFSTITDTKNIPLLHETDKKKVDNRRVTSLDSVMRPVTPLIISLRHESSDDEYDNKEKSKTGETSSSKPPTDFQKNLESFLKNIRTQQEKKSQVSKTNSKSSTSSSKENSQINISPTTSSAVKHLPISSQVEYENLLQKMKILQEAKQQRQKAGTLKRTKSSSSNADLSKQASQNSISSNSSNKVQKTAVPEDPQKTNAKESENKSSKIDDALGKIPLLDEAARIRLIEKTEINYLNHSKNLLESTVNNIKLLDENTLDYKRKDKIESKIAEIEKSLLKYKSLLRVVNTRIKTNTPKILQSQKDMIKLRNHQFKFGQICKKVGETVRGTTYELPDCEATTIQDNFLKISEKTEEIHKATNEQPYTAKQFKLLSDKVKEFVPKIDAVKENETTATQNENSQKDSVEANQTNSGSAIIPSVSQLIAACENEEKEPEKASEENEQQNVPEVHRNFKRVLEYTDSTLVQKKVKHYESPLEFMKLPSINNRKSVNQVICPFSMEGTCNDKECKYLHL